MIRIDVAARRIDVEADLSARRANWVRPEPKSVGGVFAKYAALVSSAARGAVTIPTEAPAPAAPSSSDTQASKQEINA